MSDRIDVSIAKFLFLGSDMHLTEIYCLFFIAILF